MKNKKLSNPDATNDTFGKRSDWFDFDMDRYPGRPYWEAMDKMEKIGKEYDRIIAEAIKQRQQFTKTETPADEFDNWLIPSEVIDHYPISKNTLRKLRRNKTIPCSFANNKYIFKKKDLDYYFNKHYNGKKKDNHDEVT